MAGQIRLRLFFEWGGGAIWGGNELAYRHFDVGPVEDKLDLPVSLKSRIAALSRHHDTALNWSDPTAPGPWTPHEYVAFCAEVDKLRADLEETLGPDYVIVSEQFDCPHSSHAPATE